MKDNKIKVGEMAPDFSLKETYGKDISLKDYNGENIILFFYPKDNTPG